MKNLTEFNVVIEALIDSSIRCYHVFFKSLVLEAALINESDYRHSLVDLIMMFSKASLEALNVIYVAACVGRTRNFGQSISALDYKCKWLK